MISLFIIAVPSFLFGALSVNLYHRARNWYVNKQIIQLWENKFAQRLEMANHQIDNVSPQILTALRFGFDFFPLNIFKRRPTDDELKCLAKHFVSIISDSRNDIRASISNVLSHINVSALLSDLVRFSRVSSEMIDRLISYINISINHADLDRHIVVKKYSELRLEDMVYRIHAPQNQLETSLEQQQELLLQRRETLLQQRETVLDQQEELLQQLATARDQYESLRQQSLLLAQPSNSAESVASRTVLETRVCTELPTQCCITHEEYEPDSMIAIMRCGHTALHENLKRWITSGSDCPLCRQSLMDADIEPRENLSQGLSLNFNITSNGVFSLTPQYNVVTEDNMELENVSESTNSLADFLQCPN